MQAFHLHDLLELQVRPSEGTDLDRNFIKRALIGLTVLALVAGATAPHAVSAAPAASPEARVSASQAAVDAAVREYSAAGARLAAVEADLAKNSARLDAAVANQQRLQRRLGSRASGMYRRGRFEFIEVLTSAVSFDQFASLWDALVRINRRDAQVIQELQRTRAQIAATGKVLLRRQSAASAELRRLAESKARAQRQLAGDRAAYTEYLRRIATEKAEQVARDRTPRAAPVPTATPPSETKPVGSGEWNTGVASCYGMGAVGAHTASGHVIDADSMIVAHKTLPFGTLVEFTYHGRRGVASVEDRGPYHPGRDFDLAPGIARLLGIEGVETVRWRIVSH